MEYIDVSSFSFDTGRVWAFKDIFLCSMSFRSTCKNLDTLVSIWYDLDIDQNNDRVAKILWYPPRINTWLVLWIWYWSDRLLFTIVDRVLIPCIHLYTSPTSVHTWRSIPFSSYSTQVDKVYCTSREVACMHKDVRELWQQWKHCVPRPTAGLLHHNSEP